MDVKTSDQGLPVMEEFYTLQGEGYHTGKPAYFIRVGGCDIGCSWCDVKRSWKPEIHPEVSVDEIVARAGKKAAKAVVVTGGEPTLYDLTELCNKLKQKGIQRFLETSGKFKLTGEWNWICLSPKKHDPPLDDFYQVAHELKVIIDEERDLDWALLCASRVGPDCHLYLQPEWSRRDLILPVLIKFIQQYPKWRLSLQSHKYIGIP